MADCKSVWVPNEDDLDKCESKNLVEKVKKLFNIKEDLSRFSEESIRYDFELINSDKTNGYVFSIGTLDVKNLEYGQLRDRYLFRYGGDREITELFVDLKNQIAGFSWRAKNG